MYKLKYFRILIFTFLIPRTCSEIKFNSLNEQLVMSLINAKAGKSVAASELLVRFPLCKLASIATGDTKQDLMTFLGYKEESSLVSCYTRLKESVKTMAEGDLTLVNRIFVNYTNEIDPKFILNSTEKFGVQVDKVGFNYPRAAVSYINNLVSAITFKRVSDVVDVNDININTQMFIVGGAHFKGTWEFPFDYRLTKLTKFRHFDGKVSRIPMMNKVEAFSSITAADCQALTIKFGSWRASITFVLPNTPQELPKLLEKIKNQKIYVNSLVKNMKTGPLKVTLPRFKIRTFVDWSGFLQQLGLYSIFNTNSTDLSKILKKEYENDTIALSKIKQKVFLQIDEVGVARFQSNPLRQNMALPKMPLFLEVPKFTADRPFYFEITWDFENARYEMFTGVYYGPEPGAINI